MQIDELHAPGEIPVKSTERRTGRRGSRDARRPGHQRLAESAGQDPYAADRFRFSRQIRARREREQRHPADTSHDPAANADGQIDKDERHRITQKLEEGGIDSDDRAFVERELRTPQSLDTLIQQVHGQEEAAQVYAASLFVISVDKESERSYLKYLAGASA